MGTRIIPDPGWEAQRAARFRQERSLWWAKQWWWPFGTSSDNKKQTAYREKWVEPPEPPEPWRSKIGKKWMKHKGKVLLGFGLVAAASIGLGIKHCDENLVKERAAVAASTKAEADKKYWDRVTAEAKVCEPMFFNSERLVAHKLWEVTCIDEAGKTHLKYIKGTHFIGKPQ